MLHLKLLNYLVQHITLIASICFTAVTSGLVLCHTRSDFSYMWHRLHCGLNCVAQTIIDRHLWDLASSLSVLCCSLQQDLLYMSQIKTVDQNVLRNPLTGVICVAGTQLMNFMCYTV